MFAILVSPLLGYLVSDSDDKLATSSDKAVAKRFLRRFAAECARDTLAANGYSSALIVTIGN